MAKRKLWTDESMRAATRAVKDNDMSLREASRLYNVPFETLRRRVTESVELGCRPGPATVLSDDEEEQLANYLIKMADMGFGLSPDTVKRLAYKIVERSGRKHPFRDEKAGRAWFDGFRRRHPKLTIRSPQPLSYCRALCSNPETINDFFGKLGAIYGKLNLISKPMLVFNLDETNVTIVHKPGKVVTELGRRNVYAITSAEKGKTHTILACVSASGYVLPPVMIYPRKKLPPPNVCEGAVPNTLFCNSENGWMNAELFLEFFKFFLANIPPIRPVLILMDGHGSHMSIDVIERARADNVHLLCLPAHTTHILQPLDVGVFKSFKANFSKACTKYIADNPGRVVTTDKLASLVAAAWPLSYTPVNIMAGFKKSGVFPINPSEVTDRQTMPSKAVCHKMAEIDSSQQDVASVTDSNSSSPLFPPEKEELYKKRFEEGYDVRDPDYIAWVKINHPTADICSMYAAGSLSSSLTDLSEILVLPKPKPRITRSTSTQSLNKKTVCITEDGVYRDLKSRAAEKAKAEKEKEQKKIEKEQILKNKGKKILAQNKKKKDEKKLSVEKRKKEYEEKRSGVKKDGASH